MGIVIKCICLKLFNVHICDLQIMCFEIDRVKMWWA